MQRLHTPSTYSPLLSVLVIGLVGWQLSQWLSSGVYAATGHASRTVLDKAAFKFQANHTKQTAQLLNQTRAAFNKLVVAKLAHNSTSASMNITRNTLVHMQTLKTLQQNATEAEKKLGSRLLIALRKQQNRLPAGLEALRTEARTSPEGNAVVDIKVINRTAGLKALDPYNFKIENAAGNIIRAEVPFDKLEEIAAKPEVITIREAAKYFTQHSRAAR